MDIPSERQYMPTSQLERMRMLELLEQIPLKVCIVCDVLVARHPTIIPPQIRVKGDQDAIFAHLSQEELEMWLDLRPFMQRHPFVVQADASLSRAYRLFRTMGLRHLFVGPPQPKVVGIITRKDIIGDNAKLALGRKANLGMTTMPTQRGSRELPFIPYAAYDATVGSSLRRAYAGDVGEDDEEELHMLDGARDAECSSLTCSVEI